MLEFNSIIMYANALPFVSLVFFLVFVYNNPVFDRRQSYYFMLTGSVTLFMIVVISLDFTFASSPHLNNASDHIYLFRRVTSFFNFAVSPLVPILIYNIYAKKKNVLSYYIPFIINAILCFISMFNGCVFNIKVGNYYGRGLLFMIPFLVTILYLLMLIFQSRNIYTKSKKSERTFLYIVIGILCACMYLEVMHQYVFLTWDFTSLCIILYYLLLNIHRTIIDPLTGAYNRLAYMKELSNIEKQSSCIIALIDINDFKEVNDTYGHDVGDTFLQDFTSVLGHAFSSIASIYRIGGDEFIVIAKKASDAQFQDALHEATLRANKQNMYFACGWKRYNAQQTLDDFQVEIDKLMYQNKKQYKDTKQN